MLYEIKQHKYVNLFLALMLSVSLVLTPLQVATFAQENESNDETETTQSESENTVTQNPDDSETTENDDPVATTDEKESEKDHQHEQDSATNDTDEAPTNNEEIDTVQESTNTEQYIEVDEDETTDVDKIDEEYDEDLDEDEYEYEYDEGPIKNIEEHTTSSSVTIHWELDAEDVEKVFVYLNDELVAELPANETSYTFNDLITGEGYFYCLSLERVDECNDNIFYVEPYWAEDELISISLSNIMINGEFEPDDYLLIRGIGENNKAFELNVEILSSISFDTGEEFSPVYTQFDLPVGKYEVIFYNFFDPSISKRFEIEIKPDGNYAYHPFILVYDLEEIRSDSEPFHYDVTDVTEDSFSITWNNLKKALGYTLQGYKYDNFYYEELFSYEVDKTTNAYTVTGLSKNSTIHLELIALYEYGLSITEFITIKTFGEDAHAKKVHFTDEAFGKFVGKQVGVYNRDVTIKDLEMLQNIIVDDLYEQDEVFLGGLEHAPYLTTLSIVNRDVHEIEVLQELQHLIGLYLARAGINNVDTIKHLTNLESLDLIDNNITDISSLKELTKLHSIDISYNQIDDINVLSNYSNLNYFTADANEISSIDALRDLNHLEYVSLYMNNISDVTPLQNMPELSYLDLGHNEIEDMEPLATLSGLDTLKLDGNKITTIPDLSGLTNLRELELYGNLISDISGVASATNLELLDLYDNEISDIPDLSALQNLKGLFLEENKIKDISGLTGLSNLTSLMLDNNEIEELPDLSGLENLEILYLSFNPLTDISNLRTLKNLAILDLSHTKVKDLSVLLEIDSLGLLFIYESEVNDNEVIEQLREKGVRVIFTDQFDFDREWVDREIDVTNVKKEFPETKGFKVSDDGKLIEFDLTNQPSEVPFVLRTKQLSALTNKEQILQLTHSDGIVVSIPASAFLTAAGDEVYINVHPKNINVENGISTVYELTMTLPDGRPVVYFPDGIKLTFTVDKSKVKNIDDLAIYYQNEYTGEWELVDDDVTIEEVGGVYKVTGTTYHFSLFTVLEVAGDKTVEEDPADPSEKKDPARDPGQDGTTDDEEITPGLLDEDGDVTKTDSTGKKGTSTSIATTSDITTQDGQLPKTATNMYQLLLIGFISLSAGLAMIVIRMRKAKA